MLGYFCKSGVGTRTGTRGGGRDDPYSGGGYMVYRAVKVFRPSHL